MLVLRSVFCTDLRKETDICFVYHQLIGIYNRSGKCLQRGRTDSLHNADYVWSLNNPGGKCLQRGRTDSLYNADYVWSLNNRGGKCLQRGTD